MNATYSFPRRKILSVSYERGFNHAFVPWDGVFICGETELADKLALQRESEVAEG